MVCCVWCRGLAARPLAARNASLAESQTRRGPDGAPPEIRIVAPPPGRQPVADAPADIRVERPVSQSAEQDAQVHGRTRVRRQALAPIRQPDSNLRPGEAAVSSNREKERAYPSPNGPGQGAMSLFRQAGEEPAHPQFQQQRPYTSLGTSSVTDAKHFLVDRQQKSRPDAAAGTVHAQASPANAALEPLSGNQGRHRQTPAAEAHTTIPNKQQGLGPRSGPDVERRLSTKAASTASAQRPSLRMQHTLQHGRGMDQGARDQGPWAPFHHEWAGQVSSSGEDDAAAALSGPAQQRRTRDTLPRSANGNASSIPLARRGPGSTATFFTKVTCLLRTLAATTLGLRKYFHNFDNMHDAGELRSSRCKRRDCGGTRGCWHHAALPYPGTLVACWPHMPSATAISPNPQCHPVCKLAAASLVA